MADLRPLYPTPDERAATRREMRHEAIQGAWYPPMRPDDAQEVLAALSEGLRITRIGSLPGYPTYATINYWRTAHPWFDEACVAASEAGAEKMMWETLDIADDQSRAPACREVSIKARQAMAKVLNRKRFDPATRVEVTGSKMRADELSDAELAAMVRRRERATAEDATPGAPPLADGAGVET